MKFPIEIPNFVKFPNSVAKSVLPAQTDILSLVQMYVTSRLQRTPCKTRKILGRDHRGSRATSVSLATRTRTTVREKSSFSVHRNIYSLSLSAYFPFRTNPLHSPTTSIAREKSLHYVEQIRKHRVLVFDVWSINLPG